MKVLDADVVIAFLDDRDASHRRAVRLLTAVAADRDDLVIGAGAYAETLVHATATGHARVVDAFLDDAGVSVLPVDRPTARAAAALRARHRGLRLPDALSLATALEHDAELLTFDRRLLRVAAVEAV